MRVLLALIIAVYPLVAAPPTVAAAIRDAVSSTACCCCCCCCEAGACPCAGPATPDEPLPAPAPSTRVGEAHRLAMLSQNRAEAGFLVTPAGVVRSSFGGAARALPVRERLAILCVRRT